MYLIALLIFIITVISSIVFHSLKLGITPTPSSKKIMHIVAKQLSIDYQGIIYDCGTGFGSSTLRLAKAFPKANIIGYERSPFPYLITFFVLKISGVKNVELRYEDFFDDQFEKGSWLFCYLSVNLMRKLEQKLFTDQFNGQIISHTFAMPNTQPKNIFTLRDLYRTRMYLYEI